MQQYELLLDDMQSAITAPKPGGVTSGTTTIANNSGNLDSKTLSDLLALDPSIRSTVQSVLRKRAAKQNLTPDEKRVADQYDKNQVRYKTSLPQTAKTLQLASVDTLMLTTYCKLLQEEAEVPEAEMPLSSAPGKDSGPLTTDAATASNVNQPPGNGEDLADELLGKEEKDEDISKSPEGQVYLVDLVRRAFLIDPQEVTIGPEDKDTLMIKTTPKNVNDQLKLLKQVIASYELPSEPSV